MKTSPSKEELAAWTSRRWTEGELVQAATQCFYKSPWLVLPKLRPGTGFQGFAIKEFDAFCMHPWPSTGLSRHVLEAKTTRSDFQKELKDPLKRRAGMYCATHFYFLVPENAAVVKNIDEIPFNCGLMKVGRNPAKVGKYEGKIVVPAVELADDPPTWNFIAAVVRRLLNSPPDPEETALELAAALQGPGGNGL